MQREMELQIADEGLAGNEPASPDHNPKKHAEVWAYAPSWGCDNCLLQGVSRFVDTFVASPGLGLDSRCIYCT